VVCVLLGAIVAAGGQAPVSAQMDERLVKAAALLKVALFVEWPAVPASERFVIGIAADEDFTEKVAATARSRRLHDREVVVKRLTGADEACACQLLFVGEREDARSAALLQSARARPVLTIGETTAFLREGGIVRLFRDNDRLRLQINNKPADQAGLKISSRLLQLGAHAP
jgi:hypothetical protein